MLQKTVVLYKCPSCRNHIIRQAILEGTNKNAELYSDGRYIASQLPQLPKLVKCKKCDTIFWLHKQGKISTRINQKPCKEKISITQISREDILNNFDIGNSLPLSTELGDHSSEAAHQLDRERNNVYDSSPDGSKIQVSNNKSLRTTISDKCFDKIDKAEFLSIADYFLAISVGLAENNKEELEIRIKIWWTYNDRVRKGMLLFNDKDDEADWKLNLIELLVLLDWNDFNDRILIAEIYRNLGDFNRCLSIVDNLAKEYSWISESFRRQCEISNKLVFRLY